MASIEARIFKAEQRQKSSGVGANGVWRLQGEVNEGIFTLQESPVHGGVQRTLVVHKRSPRKQLAWGTGRTGGRG